MIMTIRPLHFTSLLVVAAGAIAASWVHPGHADAPPGRYTIKNGTVIDSKTQLTWEQNVLPTPKFWMAAQSYCLNLDLDGPGWRLPSMKELQTIVDRSGGAPTIDSNSFPNTPSGLFWTSSSWADAASSTAWVIKFSDGYTTYASKSTSAYVRCVR